MLNWIADKILSTVSRIPAWLVDQSSPNFLLIRAMFGLMIIVLIIYLVAVLSSRDVMQRYLGRVSGLFSRKR